MTQKHSIDGFIPRRPSSQLGERHVEQTRPAASSGRFFEPQKPSAHQPTALRRPDPGAEPGIARNDIAESLKGIDSIDAPKDKKLFKRGGPKSRKRRIIKWTIIVILVLGLALGAWVVYKALHASGNIFKGNIFDIIQDQPLKQDANGRSNILVLGTSEDDPGHGGAYLTDSMMIVSIDQKNKNVDMMSIPRDLYVQYGMACNSGYQGKINEYFNCVNSDYNDKSAEDERMTQTRKFVGDIFGLDIQYGVHVNNTVIKQAVDAVGGVDVDIEGSGGAPGILDRNFDWRCGYKCYYVKYDNGVHHLDGEHALYLAEARGDTAPTYGLANSNFDREKNQQKIIIALKEKAATTGTLSNVGKVTSLIDALGNNLRTNFETKEIRTLMKIGSATQSQNIKTLSLFGDSDSLVTTGNYGGASVVIPSAGAFDYSDIRAFLQKNLSANPVTREGAQVVVLNGSGISGGAQTEADKLTQQGFTVSGVDNAPDGDYGNVQVYQLSNDKTATKSKLESLYKVKVKTSAPPVDVAKGTDFVVIIGKDHVSND